MVAVHIMAKRYLNICRCQFAWSTRWEKCVAFDNTISKMKFNYSYFKISKIYFPYEWSFLTCIIYHLFLTVCWSYSFAVFLNVMYFATIITIYFTAILPDTQVRLTLSSLPQSSDLLHVSRHCIHQKSSLCFLLYSGFFTPFHYQRQWVHLGCMHPTFQIINQRRSVFYFPTPDLWRTTTARPWFKATSQYCFCYHWL